MNNTVGTTSLSPTLLANPARTIKHQVTHIVGTARFPCVNAADVLARCDVLQKLLGDPSDSTMYTNLNVSPQQLAGWRTGTTNITLKTADRIERLISQVYQSQQSDSPIEKAFWIENTQLTGRQICGIHEMGCRKYIIAAAHGPVPMRAARYQTTAQRKAATVSAKPACKTNVARKTNVVTQTKPVVRKKAPRPVDDQLDAMLERSRSVTEFLQDLVNQRTAFEFKEKERQQVEARKAAEAEAAAKKEREKAITTTRKYLADLSSKLSKPNLPYPEMTEIVREQGLASQRLNELLNG